MFKHRLSKIGKASLFAACMLIAGGSLQSCEDDYYYPDKKPTWLGESIYKFLQSNSSVHTYKNYVELIDSLGEKETLDHTGSKTLFVADDDAFERFFENNPWNVKSISEMTKAQMKILFFSSMLDNAMLLEMLSSTSSNEESDGNCLRRLTSYSIIDSIPFVKGDDLPKYNKYWDALRGTERSLDSLRLAKDGTEPMMVHFLPDYLRTRGIQVSDIQFLFRKNGEQLKTYSNNEAFIFDKKLVASDVPTKGFSDDSMTITCKNGYIYRLDDVLIPPSNMAEELRLHENTNVFSHLLDRFCVPEYNASLSTQYQAYHKNNDSIFRLRYYNTKNFTEHPWLDAQYDPDPLKELLPFDPGWNQFSVGAGSAAENDMAAMFVPNDESLMEYFKDGNGRFLLEQFANDLLNEINTYEQLMTALDRVPQHIIAKFLENLMRPSFSNTVLSKFELITDDAHDPMGLKEEHVDECVIANNGVIYILNNVFGPASYQAVSAPILVFDNMKIMNQIVETMRYDSYLLAMDADYTFIVPDDSCFVYYDPVSVFAGQPKVYSFRYDNQYPNDKAENLWANVYKFKEGTYEITDTLANVKASSASNFNNDAFWKNRMLDLLEYLIVVHDEGDGVIKSDGTKNPRKYYRTKGYGVIKIDAKNPDGDIRIQGGEQLENGKFITTKRIHGQKNGSTFCTVPFEEAAPGTLASGLPTPPTKSVYDNMLEHGEEESDIFYEFFNMCSPAVSDLEELFTAAYPEMNDKDMYDTLKFNTTFYSSADGKMVNLVPFFNNFHYTVYAPSNEAIKGFVEEGFPTWDEIFSMASEHPKKACALISLMNSFIRYHFQDNSLFVDRVPFSVLKPDGGSVDSASYATALINDVTARFREIKIRNSEDETTLLVTDELGRSAKVIVDGEENKEWNIMARDISFSKTKIEGSSFAVIQPIDNVLLNKGLYGYDGEFCRFSELGNKVDTMTVKGETASPNVYLVGNCGSAKMKDATGVERVMRLAYLMKQLPESEWDKYTREEFVVDAENNPYFITNEGFLIKKNGKKYEYILDEDGNMQKVDNNGTVTERVPKTWK